MAGVFGTKNTNPQTPLHMKKKYLTPLVTTTTLQAGRCLLAGSGSTGDTTWNDAFGSDAEEDEQGNSRRHCVWDDEEESEEY